MSDKCGGRRGVIEWWTSHPHYKEGCYQDILNLKIYTRDKNYINKN